MMRLQGDDREECGSSRMPAITVVITTHNLERYIDRCLRELSEQSMQDFEVLVVDDASTDRTVAIVDDWKERLSERLQLIRLKDNLGRSAAVRNLALESGWTRGDYVLFLDGDDSIEKNMLEVLYAKAVGKNSGESEQPADVVICAYDRIDMETGRAFSTEMQGFPEEVFLPPQDDLIAFINTSPWNKLFRKNLIENLRFPDIKIGEEIVFNFNAYAKAQKIVFSDAVLIHYMVRADSAIATTSEDDIRDFAGVLHEFYKKQSGIYQEVAGFLAFLHIGLSMALRATDNPAIDIKQHIAQTCLHFQQDYGWFRKNRFLRLASLGRRKSKGLLIWLALQAYRFRYFGMALACYRKLGLHIKF